MIDLPEDLKDAIRRYVFKQYPQAPRGHADAIIRDIKREPESSLRFWREYFGA